MLVLLCCVALPVAAVDCSAPIAGAAPPSGPVAPAPGLDGTAAAAISAPSFGESAGELAVDAVLARRHDEHCSRPLASADGYQKQTEFDNTPYRYNMKPGQKMSAADFDAWMKSRGIRIVGAAPAADAVATEVAATSSEPAAAPDATIAPAIASPTAPVVAK